MYSIKCGGGFENNRPIYSGVTFGVFGKPIVFEVKADDVPFPLTVRFQLVDDITRPPAYFVVNPIISGNIVDVQFFNVTKEGSASINEPCSIVFVNQVDLRMIVHVDRIGGTPTYRLTYEFFEAEVLGVQQ
jgi:hypothetical protein